MPTKNKCWYSTPPDKEPRKGTFPVGRRQLVFDPKTKIWKAVVGNRAAPVKKSLVKGDFQQRAASIRKEIDALRKKIVGRKSFRLPQGAAVGSPLLARDELKLADLQGLTDRMSVLGSMARHGFSEKRRENYLASKKIAAKPAAPKRESPSKRKRRDLRSKKFDQEVVPVEVPQPAKVEVVERVVERIVEVRVEVPVEKIIVKEIVKEVVKVVEKIVEVPVEVEKIVTRTVPAEPKVILEKGALVGLVATNYMQGVFAIDYAKCSVGLVKLVGLKVGKVMVIDAIFSRNGVDRTVARFSQKTGKVASNLAVYEDESLLAYFLGRLFVENPLRDVIP